MLPLLAEIRTAKYESSDHDCPPSSVGLGDIQLAIRQAVVCGDDVHIISILTGGKDPAKRLQIHRRHYETSLVAAIVARFPATGWLLGSALVTEAARRYICDHPPRRPCIAEYGEAFPDFLKSYLAGNVPYVRDFAELEWHIGHVSIAIDYRAVPADILSRLPAAELPDFCLVLQPGLRYLQFSWPVDTLMTFYLTNSAPESLQFSPENVWIEVRGARGEFQIKRLTSGDLTFRRGIAENYSLGDAVEAAFHADGAFEPGAALKALVAEGLIIGVNEQGGKK